MLQKPTILYLLIATAIISVCLAIHIQSLSTPIAAGADTPNHPLAVRDVITTILGSWPIRVIAFSIGISTVMHILVTLTACRGWIRWLIAILVPTCGMVIWHNISVYLLDYHPGSAGITEQLLADLIVFSIGFASVSMMFAVLLVANTRQ